MAEKALVPKRDATVRRIGAAFIAPTTVLRQPATTISKNRRSAKPLLPTVLRPRAVTPFPAAKSTIYCSYHRPKTTSYYYFKKQEEHQKTSSSNYSKTKSSSSYSYTPRSNYSSGKSYSSYDDGYDSIYDDDDYEEDRYNSDSNYADGVDDAMDELDW